MKQLLLILVLVLSSLACVEPVKIAATQTPRPAPTQTVMVVPVIATIAVEKFSGTLITATNIHESGSLNSPVLTVAAEGTLVGGFCNSENMCFDETIGGWYWLGCTVGSDLGCQ